MTTTTTYIDELYLTADELLSNGNFAEARKVLEEILLEEPSYGKAHNALGWLYYSKLDDYVLSETHYKLAIKFEPTLPYVYYNYANLLIFLHRLDEARNLAHEGLSVGGTNRYLLWSEIGRTLELTGKFKEAHEAYLNAIKATTSKDETEHQGANLARVRFKRELFRKRILNWF